MTMLQNKSCKTLDLCVWLKELRKDCGSAGGVGGGGGGGGGGL